MARRPILIERGSPQHRALQILGFAVVGAFLLRAGLTWNNSGLSKLTDVFIIAIAVTGLNLLVGFTGQISIGHSAFFGIGAYTTAILVKTYGWTPGWTFFPAVVLCFAVGVIVGVPALRLKGLYLALVTLALGVAFPNLLNRYTSLTGGPLGIKSVRYLPPDWTPFDGRKDTAKWLYWLSLVLLIVAAVVASNLLRSRIGRAMVAVRDNETAAAVMGVNRALVKTVVFGISAAMAGLAGSLFTLKLTLADPTLFTLVLSIEFLVAMVIGGIASTWGPFVGAFVFVYLRDNAKSFGEEQGIDGLGGVTFGVLLIVVMFVASGGLVGLSRQIKAKVLRVLPKVPTPAVPPGGTVATTETGTGSPEPHS
jgi:branched-chain amino acid transport system permease protein